MELLHAWSCMPCIDIHVGPAVEQITGNTKTDLCGGCGRVTVKYLFSYWFPWPDEDES